MDVVINGGGIAGLALARFLGARGLGCTVLERAPSHRALGHFIALKGDGVAVLDRLSIREACAAAAMAPGFEVAIHDDRGRLLRETALGELDAGLGGYLLLRRSDLHQALFDALPPGVRLRFGTGVAAVVETGGGLQIETTDGQSLRADVLVGADGVHSAVRRLVFGGHGATDLGGSYVAMEVEWPEQPFRQGQMNVWFGRGRTVAAGATAPDRVAAIVYHGGEDLRPRMSSARDAREAFAREYDASPSDVRASSR